MLTNVKVISTSHGVKRFIIFHGKRHRRELDGEAVRATAPIEMDSVIAAASPVTMST